MAGNVQATATHQLQQPAPSQTSWKSLVCDIAEVVAHVAIRAFFVTAHILMAASLIPFSWHWIAIPIATVGSVTLAAFFFPGPRCMRGREFIPIPRLLENELLPANYPQGSPVGYRNSGSDCGINSEMQACDNIPIFAQWVRRPLGEGLDMDAFIPLLREYRASCCPTVFERQEFDQMLVNFQQYVPPNPPDGQAPPAPLTVRERFFRFLENYPNDFPIKAIFLAHDALRLFYEANDDAVQNRRAVSRGDSMRLRAALNQVNPAIGLRGQADADAIATAIFGFIVPESMKMHIQRTAHLNTDGLAPLTDAERLRPTRESLGLYPIHLEDEAAPNFQDLFDRSLNYGGEPNRTVNDVSYPVERMSVTFDEPPPVLNFWIYRFIHARSDDPGYWNAFLRSMHENLPGLSGNILPRPSQSVRSVKLCTPITFPDELVVQVNGEERRYRLSSFVTHQGRDNAGHYIAGRFHSNGHKYILNDSRSIWVQTEAQQREFDRELQQAYLVSYLPVPPA